jgi:hypothetical protein
MTAIPKKLPIGIQDFPSLRREGFHYVDKTAMVHQLATTGKVYFLSRPRRFGKSLLLSTLGAYFEGRRELFAGLAMEQLEQDWVEYPVLRLDLNAAKYDVPEALLSILDFHLEKWEARFPGPKRSTLSERFKDCIERAHAQTGRPVVVLVDEYDKPLLQAIGNQELGDAYKATLKSFYGVLKSSDAHLKFVLLTGVTKFGQVSVFSDLNQLQDLSLHPAYATLCGLTEEELLRDFPVEIQGITDRNGWDWDTAVERIRRMYNGYKFEENALGVYNPFSTLNAFSTGKLEMYWFATGTPTFLVELLKASDYDLRELDGVELSASAFANYRADADLPLPVIYQSGYLTIKDYDQETGLYTLGYPNDEVRSGFIEFLLPSYTGVERDRGGFHIAKFYKELKAGQVEAFMERLQCFFADFPYELNAKTERHYQVVIYLVFKLLGQFVQSEYRSAKGRADCVVWTPDRIYVFEFKLNGTAEEALAQIESAGYAAPFRADGREVVRIGVEFDPELRNIGRFMVG